MLLDSCSNFLAWLLARLIESLAWAHERTPIADLVRWKTNQLLSIVQARLVGLHTLAQVIS
jgi:hypothetical protein